MDDLIKVYGASWCGDCRRAKKFLGDQRVSYEWFDIEHDPSLISLIQELNDGKNIIPTIVFPDGSHLAEPSDEELANKLGLERAAMQHAYDLIIVGGGPAGLTTAIYAARENLETLIIDAKGLGGQAGVTERLDNYPGFPEGIAGAELADRFVRQAERYGVEMLQALSVASIEDAGAEEVRVRTANGDHYEARAVLIATGSTYRRTGAEGESDLIGAGIHFCATCDGPFYKGSEELLVLGGGNSGLEEGVFLTQFTDKVTVVEYKDRLAGSQVLQDKVAADPKMDVLLERKVTAFKPKDDGSGKIGTVVLEHVGDRRDRGAPSRGGVRVRGARPQHRLRAGHGRSRRARVHRDRRDVHDVDARRVRGRRRAGRLDEAAGERGRRGRGGRDPDPRLPRSPARRGRPHGSVSDGPQGDLRADHQGRREAEVRDRRERDPAAGAGACAAWSRRATPRARSATRRWSNRPRRAWPT